MKRVAGPVLFSCFCLIATAGFDTVMAQCPAPAPPPPAVCPVGTLTFAGAAAFAWTPATCAPALYDAARGDLLTAWNTKNICMSAPICLVGEDDAAGPLAAVDAVVPPVGQGFWYLTRGAAAGPDFTWNEAGPAQITDRDALLAALAICPL